MGNEQRGGSQIVGEQRAGTITIKGNNWGAGRHTDIKAVLESAAGEITKHLREGANAAIEVRHWSQGPMIVRRRGARANHIVLLSAKDRYWAKYSYQFAHEFCHLVANYEQRFEKPNQWFEESLCEAASLFTLRRMGVTWRESPPYKNWRSFAKHLTAYAESEAKKVEPQVPDDEAWEVWLRTHEANGRKYPYDRIGNRIVALRMLPLFDEQPEGGSFWRTSHPSDGLTSCLRARASWPKAAARLA